MIIKRMLKMGYTPSQAAQFLATVEANTSLGALYRDGDEYKYCNKHSGPWTHRNKRDVLPGARYHGEFMQFYSVVRDSDATPIADYFAKVEAIKTSKTKPRGILNMPTTNNMALYEFFGCYMEKLNYPIFHAENPLDPAVANRLATRLGVDADGQLHNVMFADIPRYDLIHPIFADRETSGSVLMRRLLEHMKLHHHFTPDDEKRFWRAAKPFCDLYIRHFKEVMSAYGIFPTGSLLTYFMNSLDTGTIIASRLFCFLCACHLTENEAAVEVAYMLDHSVFGGDDSAIRFSKRSAALIRAHKSLFHEHCEAWEIELLKADKSGPAEVQDLPITHPDVSFHKRGFTRIGDDWWLSMIRAEGERYSSSSLTKMLYYQPAKKPRCPDEFSSLVQAAYAECAAAGEKAYNAIATHIARISRIPAPSWFECVSQTRLQPPVPYKMRRVLATPRNHEERLFDGIPGRLIDLYVNATHADHVNDQYWSERSGESEDLLSVGAKNL
jgi:hypothetical protein